MLRQSHGADPALPQESVPQGNVPQEAVPQVAAGAGPDLAAKVRFLCDRGSYRDGVDEVELRETHMSFIFLAGDRVYKLKKPVRFPYLDFSTLARRGAACRAEDRLNRRLAPDVYLGVVPLTCDGGEFAIGGAGDVVDYLVAMRRLPDHATLDDALRHGAPPPRQLDLVAATLRRFYAHAARGLQPGEPDIAARLSLLGVDCSILHDARFALPQAPINTSAAALRRFIAERRQLLLQRVRARYVVDAHGDLRPEHIWLTAPPIIIDCLEFDDRLRSLDPLDEVAFLHLECERLGRRDAGERIRKALARPLAENEADGLFLFYRCQRALLRARLAIAHLYDAHPRTPEKWPAQARAYLALAAADARRLERCLGRGRRTQKARRSSMARR